MCSFKGHLPSLVDNLLLVLDEDACMFHLLLCRVRQVACLRRLHGDLFLGTPWHDWRGFNGQEGKTNDQLLTSVLPLDQLDFSTGHQLLTSWFPIVIISAALQNLIYIPTRIQRQKKRANAWWGFSSRLLTRQGPHLTTSSKWVGKPGGRTENVLLATHPL